MKQNHRQTDRIESVIFCGLIFILIFAPLAFGSVHVWAYSIVEFGIFLLVALWFINQLIFSESASLDWVKTPVNLMLVMLFALIGLQLLPLPAPMAALISPHVVADKTRLFDIMAKAMDAPPGRPPWMMSSYSFHLTMKGWLKVGAYFGMFFLVLNMATSKRRIDIFIYTLIFIGLFEAVYAIFEVFNIPPRVWWWKSRVGVARFASGTFIVSNHFAFYMEMVFCLSFGYFIAQKKLIREMPSGPGTPRTVLKTFVSWFEPESTRPKMIFFFIVTVLMGVALLMSASRGGILALGTSLLLTSILFGFKRSYRKYGAVSLILCLITLGYGLQLGIDPTLKKFENPASLYDRLHITRTIIPMVDDYPVIGVGLGNFRYVYSRYIDDFDRVSSSGYAHNDWVEAGCETGFSGLSMLLLAFGIYMAKMIRIWYGRRNFYVVGIGAGVVAGLLSVGIHSYFDFSMHIPANPLTLAVLLAIGYAVLHRRGCETGGAFFFYKKREIPLARWQRFALLALVLLVLNFAVYSVGKHVLAEAACPTEWNSTMNLNWNPELFDIDKAIAINAGNFEYHAKRAEHFKSLKAKNKKDRQAFDLEAKKSLEQAVSLNPAQGILWYRLGTIYSANKYDLYDYLDKWLPLADECYDEGIKCAPMDAAILFNTARYWVWRARLLPEMRTAESENNNSVLYRKDGIQKFQQYFQRSLAINPGNWKSAARWTWTHFPDDAVVLGIIPKDNDELKSNVLKTLTKMESATP